MGKKIRICLEVQGLGQDEYGTPCSNVVCVTLGDDDAEELTGAEYKAFLEQIKIEDGETLYRHRAKPRFLQAGTRTAIQHIQSRIYVA